MKAFPLLTALLLLLLTACSVPLRRRNVLVIGDSNAAAPRGWVYQFQQLRGDGARVNTALGGNTIGFTDDGDFERNTLENLTVYLRRGFAEMGGVDEIIIGLGTNDCKAKFGDRHGQIATNLTTLIDRTERFFAERGQEPARIVLLTPPPVGADGVVSAEFQGAGACTVEVGAAVRELAAARGYCLVDWQERPGAAVLTRSDDGIHFNEQGYEALARQLIRSCY